MSDSIPHVILGNGGDSTVAVLQWVIEQKISPVYWVSVDTGWAAAGWGERVNPIVEYARQQGVTVVRLAAQQTFAELVTSRNEFPCVKYQWCAGLLKGLPMNIWLDELDPLCTAILMLGKQRVTHRAHGDLAEFIEENEYYNDRKTWHPLWQTSIAQRDQLIQRAGFPVLNHPSLECAPCIHASYADMKRLAPDDLAKTAALEEAVGKPMFDPQRCAGAVGIRAVEKMTSDAKIDYYQHFSMGCGAPWACGE